MGDSQDRKLVAVISKGASVIFYDLAYKLSCRLAVTRDVSDLDIPSAIRVEGRADGLHISDSNFEGMRILDVAPGAELNDLNIKRVKVSLLPPPAHAPFWLKVLIDGLGIVSSVSTVYPVARFCLQLFGGS